MNKSAILQKALEYTNRDGDQQNTEEYESRFSTFLNEGYHELVHAFSPYETSEITPTDGVFTEDDLCIGEDNASFGTLVSIKNVLNENKKPIQWAYGYRNGEFIVSESYPTINVVYSYMPNDIEAGSDEPILPIWAHEALVNYIAYKELTTGDREAQIRAQEFYGAYNKILGKLKERLGQGRKVANKYTGWGRVNGGY